MIYLIIAAAIMPALVLLYYIYRRDRYQHEPVSKLLLGFFYGVLSGLVAVVLEMGLVLLGLVEYDSTTWSGVFIEAFIGAGLAEEVVKLFFLWLLLRKNKYFDEYMDGVVYAVSIGMGFAAIENIVYLLSDIEVWYSVAIVRTIFSVPGHFIFAVAMGYYYSLHRFHSSSKMIAVMILAVPVVLHGVFDWLLMVEQVDPSIDSVVWFLFVLFCSCMRRIATRKIEYLLERDKATPTESTESEVYIQ